MPMSNSGIMVEKRPMPNFHSARIRDPDDFVRIVQLKELENGIRVIGGPLKSDPDGPTEAQAYRFPKDKFTVAEAKKWLKDHDIKYIDFEPASEDKAAEGEIERRFFALTEIRLQEPEGKAKVLMGHAAVFDKITDLGWFEEMIAPGAFQKSLERGDDVVALFNHDPNHLLGRRSIQSLQVKEDDVGLEYTVDLPETQTARDIAALVKRGDLKGCSFGFITRVDEWRTPKGPAEKALRTIKECELIDISVVTFPAYPQTDVALRSLNGVRKKEKDLKVDIKRRRLKLKIQ